MKKEEKESLIKFFNRLIKDNIMFNEEETLYMPQRMRLAAFFAAKLCKKSTVKNNWFISQKKVAEKLGLREDTVSKYLKELNFLFHRDPRIGTATRYWRLGPASKTEPKQKVEKMKEEKVEQQILKAELCSWDEDEFFDEPPDEIENHSDENHSDENHSDENHSDENHSEKSKKEITFDEWQDEFTWEVKTLNDYSEPFLYFDKIFCALNMDYTDQHNFDICKVQGVSKSIKKLMGSSYCKQNIVNLCEAYAKEKLIGRPKYFKNLWMTNFKKYVAKSFSGTSAAGDKEYFDNLQISQMKETYSNMYEAQGVLAV
jgi:hypothetical protein